MALMALAADLHFSLNVLLQSDLLDTDPDVLQQAPLNYFTVMHAEQVKTLMGGSCPWTGGSVVDGGGAAAAQKQLFGRRYEETPSLLKGDEAVRLVLDLLSPRRAERRKACKNLYSSLLQHRSLVSSKTALAQVMIDEARPSFCHENRLSMMQDEEPGGAEEGAVPAEEEVPTTSNARKYQNLCEESAANVIFGTQGKLDQLLFLGWTACLGPSEALRVYEKASNAPGRPDASAFGGGPSSSHRYVVSK